MLTRHGVTWNSDFIMLFYKTGIFYILRCNILTGNRIYIRLQPILYHFYAGCFKLSFSQIGRVEAAQSGHEGVVVFKCTPGILNGRKYILKIFYFCIVFFLLIVLTCECIINYLLSSKNLYFSLWLQFLRYLLVNELICIVLPPSQIKVHTSVFLHVTEGLITIVETSDLHTFPMYRNREVWTLIRDGGSNIYKFSSQWQIQLWTRFFKTPDLLMFLFEYLLL